MHEGLHASSGHYYAYLLLDGRWLKFNDETVWEATKEQAFKHNFGGSVSTIEYNSRNMTVEGKDMQNRATAYMLVYQSKAMKNKLMDRHIDYPEWLLESNAN